MRKIAFFDFDGTITFKDTMLEVIKFQKGKTAFYKGILVNLPILVALKLKLVSKQFAKEKVLKFFFKGIDISMFQQQCDAFADTVLPSMLRLQAIAEIKKLQSAGFEIVIVSASAQNWIQNWCSQMNIQLIASRLEAADNVLTGKLIGKNCTNEEKVIRIKAKYNLAAYDEIYCYGDSNGDKQMLALATKAFYKPFRQ